MKSPNETNVGLNDTDPVNAIIDADFPQGFVEGLTYAENNDDAKEIMTALGMFQEVQRAAVLRFCKAVEAADHVCVNDNCLTQAYWRLRQLIAEMQQEKK